MLILIILLVLGVVIKSIVSLPKDSECPEGLVMRTVCPSYPDMQDMKFCKEMCIIEGEPPLM